MRIKIDREHATVLLSALGHSFVCAAMAGIFLRRHEVESLGIVLLAWLAFFLLFARSDVRDLWVLLTGRDRAGTAPVQLPPERSGGLGGHLRQAGRIARLGGPGKQ